MGILFYSPLPTGYSPFSLSPMIAAAPAVGHREHEGRDHEHQMHADKPGELAGLEHGVDVHEGLEDLDRRDRDDRGQELLLQAAEIDLGHPVRPVRMAAGVDLRDEVFVAGEHHDQDQIAGQRDIDQREHAEDDVGLLRARRMNDDLPQHHAEFQQQHGEADDEAEIERRHQPAAVEQHAFKPALDRL